jgi:predicted  nucleic acid-binding Zn-ribbon protein
LTIADQILALEELAAVDAELRALDEQIQKERGALGTLRESLKQLEEKLTGDRAKLASLEKARNDQVLEVRSMMQQLEHSREKMGRARNEREANAAQRELEELRKLVRDREDEIGRLTTEAEVARQQIEATETDAKKIQDELGASEGDTEARLASTERARAERSSGRDAIVKKLPPALYRRYELVRQKRGTGLAQTSDGTCKACNMSLPPQLFHRLRREPMLEQCPSCNRIIYFVAPPPPAEKPDKAEKPRRTKVEPKPDSPAAVATPEPPAVAAPPAEATLPLPEEKAKPQ